VVPIALATGWSALLLWLLRVPLNPLSAMLGALVLAISTEFAVLLSARFEAERAAGHAPAHQRVRRRHARRHRAQGGHPGQPQAQEDGVDVLRIGQDGPEPA
jgi:hypothetical protein